MKDHPFLAIGLILLCAVSAITCGPSTVIRKSDVTPAHIDLDTKFLKAYRADGSLYVLSNWLLDTATVSGFGTLYDANRTPVESGQMRVPRSQIVLYESNTLGSSTAGTGLMVALVAHAALTAYCIANPKACFGSCPTFYINNGTEEVLMAEGFSSSILPSREADDIDALPFAKPIENTLTVRMKNEALETHVVRDVSVLAVAHKDGERVFKTDDGTFFAAREIASPVVATAAEGIITDQLRALDGNERRSWTDSTDLATKEWIDLDFDPHSSGNYGIAIAARQTFVSTYLFYQELSYLGSKASDVLARAERGDRFVRNSSDKLLKMLGGIEVWTEDSSGNWKREGEAYEMGPIATDIHLVTISGISRPKHVRLRLAQGSWRIDWVALAKLDREVQPIVVHPSSRAHTADQVLLPKDTTGIAALLAPKGTLVTQPGDEYVYTFDLPQGQNCELFLKARGYYLEWMREDWLLEENPTLAALMLLDPKGSLKREAARFKDMEGIMETSFWKTKISRNIQ